MNKLNLIDGKINQSNLFLHMPLFDEIYDEGFLEGKVRQYQAIREDQPCRILVLNIIRKDEDIIWQAFQDLIKRSVTEAAVQARGVYIFDLLTMDIHQEVKTFNHQEITTVILNHSRKCAPGEKRLIKYSSVYGLLQKLSIADWGKVTLKTAVEVFKDEDHFLDLMIKQLVKNFEFTHEPGILLLNDLSQQPIYRAEDEKQQQRIKVLLDKQLDTSIDFPPEVYIQDKNGVRELFSGSEI